MSEIIAVAFSARWRLPVCLVQEKKVKKILGPAEAIRYMRSKFGDRAAPPCRRAIDICFAALRRETDIDTARTFFLAAYEDQLARAAGRQDS